MMKQALGDHSKANDCRAAVKGRLPRDLHNIFNGPRGTGRQSGGEVDRHQVVLKSPDRPGAWSLWMELQDTTLFVRVFQRPCQPFLFHQAFFSQTSCSHAGPLNICDCGFSSMTTSNVIIITFHSVFVLCIVLLHWLCAVYIHFNNKGVRESDSLAVLLIYTFKNRTSWDGSKNRNG